MKQYAKIFRYKDPNRCRSIASEINDFLLTHPQLRIAHISYAYVVKEMPDTIVERALVIFDILDDTDI